MTEIVVIDQRPSKHPKRRWDVGGLVVSMISYATVAFLLVPIGVVIGASFSSGSFVRFPPQLPLSVEWYGALFESSQYLLALQNSLVVAAGVVVVSVAVGSAAALGFTARDFRGKQALYTALVVPFLIPGLVIGIGLLMSLPPLGLTFLVGSKWMVVLGHALWATPLVFLVMVGVFSGIDRSLIDAARNLGAPPWRAFLEITVPLARAGILASIVLAFIVSFHEFIIALFLTDSGSRTLPVVVWNSLRYEVSPIIAALDTIMVVSVVTALVIVGRLVGIDKIRLH